LPKYVKTGVAGLDAMLYGGIPEKNQVLLAGGPGTGKTLLSFEYLYRNAKAGNTSLFFALEEDPKRIVENFKGAFPELADVDDLLNSKKLIIDGQDPSLLLHAGTGESSPYEFGKVIADMESLVVSTGATRVVVDSLSVLEMLVSDPSIYRKSMLALSNNLRRLGVTSILTSEMPTPERDKLEFRTEFFIFDGIIVMYETGEEARRMLAMEIIKMRGSKHSFVTTPYEITPNGFNVIAAEGTV
jgi:KaiC/GvpD/RAD55 family RecA-like ATPase